MCVLAAAPVLIVFSVSVNIVILVYCIAHMSGNMMRVTAQRLFSQFVLVLGRIEVKQTCPPHSSSFCKTQSRYLMFINILLYAKSKEPSDYQFLRHSPGPGTDTVN